MRAVGMGGFVAVSLAVAALALGDAKGQEVVYPETVVVGNPGNPADSTGYGAVPYVYRIGKYEVTNEEYCEFLNAVDKDGRLGLWRHQMGQSQYGGIARRGSPGDFTYTVKGGMARKPVVLVSWNETLRFCNWLSNGKGAGSTEKGAYMFVDEWGEKTIKMPNHATLAAGEKTQWVLASENEWYKAAYYDPNKPNGAGYWPYPAAGNNPPNANLNSNQPSEVGSHKNSASPYGTFDQGGNVWEWNETKSNGTRGVRGGSFWINDGPHFMRSSTRYVSNPPEFVFDNYGFRVVALGGSATTTAAVVK